MAGLTHCLIGWLTLTLSPVPAEAPPDPFARAALGIQAQESQMVIGEVFANMPAAKAGIKTGDRIIRVGSMHPQVFKQVIDEIGSYRPGAIVEVEVERDGERKIFRVKLVPRPAEFDARQQQPLPFPNFSG